MTVIRSCELERVERRMTRAVGTSLGRSDSAVGYIVRLVADDGLEGIGWAHENGFIAGETAASIRSVIEEVIAPVAIGRHAQDIAVVMEEVEKRLVFNYRAKAAIDMAMHDLSAKAAGIPVFRLLGGGRREAVECIRMIGLDTPQKMAEEAEELGALGFRHFKLKIDATDEDIDRVRAVAAVAGDGSKLVLDANQAYTPKQIIQLMDRLHDCPIAILEQPVPVHDIDGLALVRRSVRPLVEADESIRTPADAMRIIERQAADIISLKVPKMGGFYWTRKIADLCQSAGIPNLVGANVGSCIIDLAHTHLACSHPNITSFACEIGESMRLSGDVAEGLDIRAGRSYAPTTAGLGARLLKQSEGER